MYCVRCGNKIEMGQKFCTNCGNNIAKKNIEKEVESSSNKGNISLVIGIIAFMFPLLPLAIVGLVLGMKEPNKDGKRVTAIILNTIDLIISLIVTVFWIFLFLAILNPSTWDNHDYDYYDSDEEWDEYDREGYDNQVIGDDLLGYLVIPNDWYRYAKGKNEKTIQYSYANRYFITLDILEDTTREKVITDIQNRIQIKSEITQEEIILADLATTVLHIRQDNHFIDYYVLQTEDGFIHTIKMEGPNQYSEFFEIPKSYQFIRPELMEHDSL